MFLYSRSIFNLLDRLTGSEAARSAVKEASGVAITDLNQDQLPDTPEQLAAAYGYMLEKGIPLDGTTLAYNRSEVRQVLAREGEEYSTVFSLGILGAREQANLAAARKSLDEGPAPVIGAPDNLGGGDNRVSLHPGGHPDRHDASADHFAAGGGGRLLPAAGPVDEVGGLRLCNHLAGGPGGVVALCLYVPDGL